MPHCTKCGTMVADNTAFCSNCGTPQRAAAAASPGISENVAGLLCYVVGWITGLIFLLIDKRPFVRFHAAQSLVLFGGLHIIRMALSAVFGLGWFFGGGWGWTGWGLAGLVSLALGLLTFVLWIVCMIKAYQGDRFRVPLAADIADSIAK